MSDRQADDRGRSTRAGVRPEDDPYRAHTFEEMAALPTVYRDDLFSGKSVLVSGGAGGIGIAIATLFGRLGATVVSVRMVLRTNTGNGSW